MCLISPCCSSHACLLGTASHCTLPPSLPLLLWCSVLVKFDHIEGMETVYIQVQGKDRGVVEEMGRRLGLDGTYIPHSYIELVQIGNLTEVRWQRGGRLALLGTRRCCLHGLVLGGEAGHTRSALLRALQSSR